MKWFGPDMSVLSSISARLMETWAHDQAVYDLNAMQLRFVEHEQVIEAFAPNRSDEALDVAVLPR